VLYAALCRRVPGLHAPPTLVRVGGPGPGGGAAEPDEDGSLWREVAIHPILGQPIGERRVRLTAGSCLTVRTDVDRIRDFLPLAGKRLVLARHEVRVGVPQVRPLRLAPSLYSHLVVIKNAMEPEAFLQAARRDLTELGIRGEAKLVPRQRFEAFEGRSARAENRCTFLRRTIRVRHRELVGHALVVEGLSADNSLRLQEVGLGGRRRFGCGVFVPSG
jgi:CRISPR-associated protein Cas6